MHSISPLDWVISEGCASPNLGEGPHPSELIRLSIADPPAALTAGTNGRETRNRRAGAPGRLDVVCAEGDGSVLNRLDHGPLAPA